MDFKQVLTILAFLLLPLLVLAQETSQTDTTQVINEPTTLASGCSEPEKHFQIFLSDAYIGWGGNSTANSEYIKKRHSEVGILNFVAFGYNFNQHRTMVSAGIGFNWSGYRLKKPAQWTRSDDGVVWISTTAEPYKNHRASLLVRSMQFPIMIHHNLGHRFNIAAGPVLNWNFYASMSNGYDKDKDDYVVTTRGLHQRKFSVDGIVRLTWRGVGAYLRYSPQSLFKRGYGPEIKNRWSIGLMISGLNFGSGK